MAPFERSGPTFTAMGRFGNVMLTNGETDFRAEAKVGEVVRLHVVDTANTRIFNFAVRGARMKLVGGDSGRFEREDVHRRGPARPSERVTVDVLFDQPGETSIENRTPDHTYDLGHVTVSGEGSGEAAAAFEELRVDPELSAERERSSPTSNASRTRLWPSTPRCRCSTAPAPREPRATSARCIPKSPTPRPPAVPSAA